MRSCPRCGLLSPDKSVLCDCGFDLVSDVRSELARERVGWRANARKTLWSGVFIGGAGAILTTAGYLGASVRGGTFLVFHGMIVGGLVMAWRGYNRLRHIADVEATDKKSQTQGVESR